MTFAFPAYHVQDFDLPLPVTEAWIQYAAAYAGLIYSGPRSDPSGWYWSVTADMNLMTWGSNIKIWLLAPQRIRIRSECVLPTQCIDWGKNREVVERLASFLGASMNAQLGYGRGPM